MNPVTPKKVAILGGLLIAASGVVNTVLGIRIDALIYETYPGGRLGHVGILSGIAAIGLGLLVAAVALRQYDRDLKNSIVGGILTILLGHLGAVTGALYIGTAGVVLCYGAAIWLFVDRWRRTRRASSP